MKEHNNDRAPGNRPFAFQNLDVYKLMLEYLALEHKECRSFPHDLKDQMDRAANSIILNFGEGSGKKSGSRDRARYYGTSNGSATESVGGWDVARIRGFSKSETCDRAQALLDRISAMLSRIRS